jgi:hypothetical protein
VKLASDMAALETMSPAQLRAEWRRVYRTPAPEDFTPDLLRRGIAWRLQERVHGGLAAAVVRDLTRVARQLAKGSEPAEREPILKPGTRLVREWHGRSYHVLVLDDGVMFEERRYSSLSHVARAITGTSWSGPRFFGLKRRRKPPSVRKAEVAAHG